MKLTIKSTENRGYRVVKALAIISKSIKKGIPRRFQKTWTMRTVAPEFTAIEMETSIKAEAARWEAKIIRELSRQADAKKVSDNEMTLAEYESRNNPN